MREVLTGNGGTHDDEDDEATDVFTATVTDVAVWMGRAKPVAVPDEFRVLAGGV